MWTTEVLNPETGEVKKFTEEEYIAERDRLLLVWQNAKAALDAAKETELQARKAAVLMMHDPSKSGKTENVLLGNGYKAKLKVPIRYGFVKNEDDRVDKKRIDLALQQIEKDGSAGELVAERLIKWTPDLSLTEYKLLPDKWKAIIDEVIVTSEGTPTLEIVEPKAKK